MSAVSCGSASQVHGSQGAAPLVISSGTVGCIQGWGGRISAGGRAVAARGRSSGHVPELPGNARPGVHRCHRQAQIIGAPGALGCRAIAQGLGLRAWAAVSTGPLRDRPSRSSQRLSLQAISAICKDRRALSGAEITVLAEVRPLRWTRNGWCSENRRHLTRK